MGVFKNLLHLKPKIIKQEPEKKPECWYNNAQEQMDNRADIPVDAAGSVNSFEYGIAKSNAKS